MDKPLITVGGHHDREEQIAARQVVHYADLAREDAIRRQVEAALARIRRAQAIRHAVKDEEK